MPRKIPRKRVPKPLNLNRDLLTQPEIAELFGTSLEWVRDKIQSGEIPAFRLGDRLIRVRRSALDAWLARQPAVATLEADEPDNTTGDAA